MKKAALFVTSVLGLLLMIIGIPVFADDVKHTPGEPDIEKLPELGCNEYSVYQGINLVDENSPDYDPSLVNIPRFHLQEGNNNYNLIKSQAPYPGDADYGTFLSDGTGADLWQAYQKIDPDLTLSENHDVLYAPTLKGADGCRLETAAFYMKSENKMIRRWGVYVHDPYTAGIGYWGFLTDMNEAFYSKYADTANNVIARVEKDGTKGWKASLFNRTTSSWDVIKTVTGNAAIKRGWDAWEQWYLSNKWPKLPKIQSQNLLVQVNGTPHFVTDTFGSLCDQGVKMPYARSMKDDFYNWTVGP